MKLIVIIIICIILLILFATLLWILVQKEDFREKGDIGIILGCDIGSELINQRLYIGYKAYIKGSVNKLIVTGGGSGEIAEGLYMEEVLLKSLVPKSDIIVESKARNTFENLRYSFKLIDHIKEKRVIVCTNRFHIARVKMISKHLGAYVSVLTNEEPVEKRMYFREIFAFLKDFISILIQKITK